MVRFADIKSEPQDTPRLYPRGNGLLFEADAFQPDLSSEDIVVYSLRTKYIIYIYIYIYIYVYTYTIIITNMCIYIYIYTYMFVT